MTEQRHGQGDRRKTRRRLEKKVRKEGKRVKPTERMSEMRMEK